MRKMVNCSKTLKVITSYLEKEVPKLDQRARERYYKSWTNYSVRDSIHDSRTAESMKLRTLRALETDKQSILFSMLGQPEIPLSHLSRHTKNFWG